MSSPEAAAAADESPATAPTLPPVELLDGLPSVVTDGHGLARAIEALGAGHGPVAVDAERASGFKYGQSAYLVQFYRRGSGTWLIDPTGFESLASLGDALARTTWILHAASQDLPCLREVGLVPDAIFDTELAARLLGKDRVGLGPLVESDLGRHLAKGHGAADWSKRPLPDDWLRYAALDVEVLVDLFDILAAELVAAGKDAWAQEEFAAVLAAPEPAPRRDPWRRTSGLHKVRGRRSLAIVRALWESRDALARQIDISPGRMLPDAAIVAASIAQPADRERLASLPEFVKGNAAKHLSRWWRAIEQAQSLPESDLPAPALPSDGPPPPRLWRERNPEAAERLARARTELAELAESHSMPVENLLPPDAVRRCAWSPPEPLDSATIAAALSDWGSRPWQVSLTADALVGALAD